MSKSHLQTFVDNRHTLPHDKIYIEAHVCRLDSSLNFHYSPRTRKIPFKAFYSAKNDTSLVIQIKFYHLLKGETL